MVYNGIVGIVIVNKDSIPRILHVHHFPIPPNLHSIPYSCRPCSSSNGLLLFLEDDCSRSQFHICNPFLDYSTGYRAVTTQGMPSQASIEAAVISLDLSDPSRTIFYISCPLQNKKGIRGFASFSSDSGWISCADRSLKYRNVFAESATSCGTIAYWLTNCFADVVCYDPVNRRVLPCIHNISGVAYKTGCVQLGVVKGDRLCIVVANEVSVSLHLLAEDMSGWEPVAFARFQVQVMENTMGWRGSCIMPIVRCREIPEVLRFESSRLQVLLLIDEAIYLWENEGDGESMVLNFVSRGVFNVDDEEYFETALPIVYTSSSFKLLLFPS